MTNSLLKNFLLCSFILTGSFFCKLDAKDGPIFKRNKRNQYVNLEAQVISEQRKKYTIKKKKKNYSQSLKLNNSISDHTVNEFPDKFVRKRESGKSTVIKRLNSKIDEFSTSIAEMVMIGYDNIKSFLKNDTERLKESEREERGYFTQVTQNHDRVKFYLKKTISSGIYLGVIACLLLLV